MQGRIHFQLELLRVRLVLNTSFKTTHPEHGSMKKNRKSSAGKNHRQKGGGQARLKSDNNNLPDGRDRLSKSHEAKPRDPAPLRSGATGKPARGTDDQKRKLWDRKQAELEARRAAAESRRREAEAERRRSMRMAGGITGVIALTLAGALTWYFA
jgi:hypothetical protein